jgi:hypothetical protein
MPRSDNHFHILQIIINLLSNSRLYRKMSNNSLYQFVTVWTAAIGVGWVEARNPTFINRASTQPTKDSIRNSCAGALFIHHNSGKLE